MAFFLHHIDDQRIAVPQQTDVFEKTSGVEFGDGCLRPRRIDAVPHGNGQVVVDRARIDALQTGDLDLRHDKRIECHELMT